MTLQARKDEMLTRFQEFRSGFYTLMEAAEAAGVNRATIWRWEQAGRLVVYRIGREGLIEKAEVQRLKRERLGGKV